MSYIWKLSVHFHSPISSSSTYRPSTLETIDNMEDLSASALLIAGVSTDSTKSSYPENDTESNTVSSSNNEDDTEMSNIVSTDPLPVHAVAKGPLATRVEEDGQKVEGEVEEKSVDKSEENSEKESGGNNDGKSEGNKEKPKQKDFWGACVATLKL